MEKVKNNHSIIKSELYGIPQKRHRVILLGIRNDLSIKNTSTLKCQNEVDLESLISDLPKLRCGLSRESDSAYAWEEAIRSFQSYGFRNDSDLPKESAKLETFMKETSKKINYLIEEIVKNGEGDNNLHLHTGMDSIWFVLKGRVKFYGEDDVALGEYGPQEGLIMPRNNVYWFAAVGNEDLELLQCVGYDRDVKNERVDMAARKWEVNTTEHIDGRVPVAE